MRVIDCEKAIRQCMQSCLLKAIDTKMKEEEGKDWFQKLYADEQAVRQKDKERGDNKKNTVLEVKHTHINKCDLQAVLKMLQFRKKIRNTTFRHVINTESTKVLFTVESLVRFRNAVLAHEEIAVAPKDPGDYSYDNVILDMLYILRCFPKLRGTVRLDEGVKKNICFYKYALQVYQQYKDEGGLYDYAVADVIKEYGLDITEEAFHNACDEVGIPAFRTEGKVWYFSSRSPKADVERIQELLRHKHMEQEVDAAKQEADAARREADAAKQETYATRQAAQRQAQQARQATYRDRNNKKLVTVVAVGVAAVVLLAIFGSVISGVLKAINKVDIDVPGIVGNDTAPDERIQEEIDTFVEDPGNTVNLKVGEGHKPGGAVWLNGGGGSCYSTNEAVVTISSTGNVKAVGEGEAFVVIKAGGGMFNVYKYTVQGKYQTQEERIQQEIENFSPNALNHTKLTVGKTHTPTAAVWLNGGTGSCYSTDESVVTVSASGTATAVGKGEAFVVIQTDGDMYSIHKYTVK